MMRKTMCAQRGPMITEYQASYVHPGCYKPLVYPAQLKNPYHTLRGTSGEMAAFRTLFVLQQWLNHVSRVPEPPTLQLDENCCVRKAAVNNMHYNTVYKTDYRAWEPEKYRRTPMKEDPMEDHLNENRTIGAKKKPFDGLTTYKRDYVPHKVQPRCNNYKPTHTTNNVFPQMASMPTRPQNQEYCNGPNPCFDQMERQCRDYKYLSCSSPRDRFQSTKCPEMGEPMCQVSKSFLFSMQNKDNIMEAYQMMKCCKSWNGQQWFNRC